MRNTVIAVAALAAVAVAGLAGCGSSQTGSSQTGSSKAQADATVCATANIIDMQAANQALPGASPALRALVNRWEADLQAGSTADTATDPDNPAVKLPADAVDSLNIDNWCKGHGDGS